MNRRTGVLLLSLVFSLGVLAGAPRPTVGAVLVPPVYHVPVLMYHRIAPAEEIGDSLRGLVVDPALFEAQLAGLKATGWRSITSAQLASAMLAGRPIPARTFVITIDDGRDDGYHDAYPILRRLGFVATYFVIAGRAGRPGYLTWDQMNEMVSSGMEIGNHTLSHVSSRDFTLAEAESEVYGAQDLITAHVGVTPVSFAYPFGLFPANLRSAISAAGLEIAYTTVEGAREAVGEALLSPRVRVEPSASPSLLLALVTDAAFGIHPTTAASAPAAAQEDEPAGTSHAGRPTRFEL